MKGLQSVLLLAEHDNKELKHSTFATLAAATEISDEIIALIIGYQCREVAEQLAKLEKIKKVFWVDATHYQHELAEDIAFFVSQFVRATAAQFNLTFSHVLTGATTFGKNILPRIAGLLNVGQISDVLQIISSDTFVRPIYAGNALVTVQSLDGIKLLTVRTTAFTPLSTQSARAEIAAIEKLSPLASLGQSQFLDLKQEPSDRPELTSAKIVISGGRGLQSQDNFTLLFELADKLGAAIGASRAAVDAGFVPNDYQVGQTGKVVAPNLYIAVGISGAIQHISGMKDSKVIVAINKDKDAPIFQIADYGLVGDLFQIIPELSREIKVRNLNKVG